MAAKIFERVVVVGDVTPRSILDIVCISHWAAFASCSCVRFAACRYLRIDSGRFLVEIIILYSFIKYCKFVYFAKESI